MSPSLRKGIVQSIDKDGELHPTEAYIFSKEDNTGKLLYYPQFSRGGGLSNFFRFDNDHVQILISEASAGIKISRQEIIKQLDEGKTVYWKHKSTER